MHNFISYVRRHLAVVIAIIGTLIIFYIVFSLYRLPVEAVAYAAALSVFLFCLIASLRFISFSYRHRKLERLKKCILVSFEELPQPSSIIESDYQELLHILNEDRQNEIFQKDMMFTDMQDYYTIWAHQIKTPIAAMRLLIQSESELSQELNSDLTEQLFKIEQYVEMVLGYIRTESISEDLQLCACNLDDIIRQTVRKYSKQFIKKKIKLSYDAADITVVTDEKWLCFVIEQILSNSLKYTETGEIAIHAETDSKGSITIKISDTGIGIRPEDLPRVGEKGFTGYNGHEDKKSTGIGLYLCRKIMKKLSGTIQLESEPGVGTVVYIRI